MNATMRSFNRAAVVIGAPVGGLVADAVGFRFALWLAAAGIVVAALVLAASPFRHAGRADFPLTAEVAASPGNGVWARWQAPRVMEQLPPCDIVMKGGITSGVVYPLAAVELSKDFRFVNIGGTSAGAIAAAAVAAAEAGRTTGRGAGFERLAALPAQLQDQLGGLFQPQPATRPVYRLIVGGLGKHGAGRAAATVAGLLRNFPVGALVGAVPGILLAVVAAIARDGWPPLRWLSLAFGVVLAGIGLLVGSVTATAVRVVRDRAGQRFRPLLRYAGRPRCGGGADPVAGRPARRPGGQVRRPAAHVRRPLGNQRSGRRPARQSADDDDEPHHRPAPPAALPGLPRTPSTHTVRSRRAPSGLPRPRRHLDGAHGTEVRNPPSRLPPGAPAERGGPAGGGRDPDEPELPAAHQRCAAVRDRLGRPGTGRAGGRSATGSPTAGSPATCPSTSSTHHFPAGRPSRSPSNPIPAARPNVATRAPTCGCPTATRTESTAGGILGRTSRRCAVSSRSSTRSWTRCRTGWTTPSRPCRATGIALSTSDTRRTRAA